MQDRLTYLRTNWFWPLTICLLALAWLVATLQPADIPPEWELAFLFDALVTLPVLYIFCYRTTLSRAALAIRIVALQCLGIWLASKIVPVAHQDILPRLAWLRNAGLAVLLVVEIRLAAALFKVVFTPGTDASQLEELGMPQWLAKIALLEAKFWRLLLGRFRK